MKPLSKYTERHIMIDLETMGLTPDGAIVSIGAALFSPHSGDIRTEFYKRVSLESSVKAGMKIDPATLIWWLGQGDEARRDLIEFGRFNLKSVLEAFISFYQDTPVDGVWSHGSNFDIVLMERAFDLCELRCPWTYRQVRDTRTLFALAGVVHKGNTHNALQDAIAQVATVHKAYKELGLGDVVVRRLLHRR